MRVMRICGAAAPDFWIMSAQADPRIQRREPGHDRHHQLDLNHPAPRTTRTQEGSPAMTATTNWT
jgi:hypothetical protein